MSTGTPFTLDTLRRRRWRGLVLFAWLALALVNLTGVLGAQAAGLPSDAEILASICHSGAVAEGSAAPVAPEARHCPLCLVMGSGTLAPPPGQVVVLRQPVETTPVAIALADDRRPSRPATRVFAPRAPPSVA